MSRWSHFFIMRRALFVLAIFASSAPAQPALSSGARVRTIPAEKHDLRRRGTLLSLVGDSAIVNFESTPELELPANVLNVPVKRLEFLAASGRRTGPGAL